MNAPISFPAARFRVGEFEVLPDRGLLLHQGRALHLEPKVMGVLCALAARPGEVLSRDTLIDQIWAVEYGADESLTRAISLLRKTFRQAGGGSDYLETVPKRGYRLAAPVEAGAEPKEAPGAATSSPTRLQKGLLGFGLLAAISILVATLALLAARPDSGPEPKVMVADRIEVGEFRALGDDPKVAEFAEGLAAGISGRLTDAGLDTVSTENRPQSGPLAEFALRGFAAQEGARMRAQVEVFDQPSGAVVWSETFEADNAGLPVLRERTAVKTAGVLSCALSYRGSHDMEVEVFRRYAQFCAALRSNEARPNLTAFTQRVVEADPDSPTAQALHALLLAWSTAVDWKRWDAGKRESKFTLAAELARKALTAEPDNVEAQLALAISEGLPESRIEMDRHIRQALSAGWPQQSVVHLYATLLRQVGRLNEALLMYEQSAAADPLDIFAMTRIAWMQAVAGNLPAARAQLDRVAQVEPDWDEIHWWRIAIEIFYGEPADARAMLDSEAAARHQSLPLSKPCFVAYARARAAALPDTDALVEVCGSFDVNLRARFFASLGDLDRAYADAAQIDPAWPNGSIFLFYPEMREFRRDPRFWPLAARFGLVDYWLETERWPDFCSEPDLPFDCKEAAERTAARG